MSIVREWLLQPIIVYLKEISMKQSEAVAILESVSAQITKVSAEVTQAIADARNQDVSPEMEAVLTRIQGSIQSLDDLNPDTPTGGDGGETTDPTA